MDLGKPEQDEMGRGHLVFCFAVKLGTNAACEAAPRREGRVLGCGWAAEPGCHPVGWGERPEAELLPGLRMPLALFGLSWPSLSLADVCLAFFLTPPRPGRGEIQQCRRLPGPTTSIPGAGAVLGFPCCPI